MTVPEFKLVSEGEAVGNRRSGIDWDEFLDAIPPGKMAEFDREIVFERNARAILYRRQKSGGRLGYYCFAKGAKFYIARREEE